MQTLFSPAIALMNRLSSSQKFLVLGCLSMLPILTVIYILYQNLNRVIFDSQKELDGLGQVEVVTKAIQLLQQHRGLSTAMLGGVETLHDKLLSKEQETGLVLNTLEHSINPSAQAKFKDIQAGWAQIQQNAAHLSVEAAYAEHTKLISQLLNLENTLSDDASLYLDNELDSYHLIMLLTSDLPMALEHIGQLRAYGVGSLAKKNITAEDKLEMLILKARIEQLIHHIDYVIEDTSRYNPALKRVLDLTRENIDSAVLFITHIVIPDITQEKFSIDPQYYYTTVTLALDNAYRQIYDSFLPTTEQLIKIRIDNTRKTLWLSIGVPGCTFILIIYFMIGAHLSLKNRMAMLVRTVKAFTAGDFKQRTQLSGHDEISQAVCSFNEMANGFEALLEKRKQDDIRLQSIINSALDALVQMDAEGILLGWNRQAEQIFGWATAEVLGQLLHEIIIPERFREAHQRGLKHFLTTSQGPVLNKRIEIVALHRDGHEFPIELAITPYQLADTIEFSAFVRDISRQKQAILALQGSEERYRALFDSSRDALMTLSPARGFLSGNAAAISLFACKDEQEFLVQNPASLSPERQADGVLSIELAQQKMGQALADGSMAFEWLHRRLNGEIFSAEVQLSRVDIDNEPMLQATVRDVTDRKRFQAALIASEARIRAVLRTMSDGVVLIDEQGCMQLVNDEVTNLFGYVEDELLGQDVKMLMPEPYYSEHDGYLRKHAETNDRVIIGRRIEVEGKCKDGRLVPIELSVNELMDDVGRTYIGVMRDITHRKAFEQLHETARLEAERLAHAKSEFLANMSHEIRTPLNAVIGLAKMSIRENHGRNLLENSVRIHDAGLHLLGLVNDILDFSKIEAGKMTLDLHPFKLEALIDDAVSLVNLRTKEKHLSLKVKRPDHLPEWVIGDSLRLRQILVNLLSNAIKFTEHGHVTLAISRRNDDIEIRVTDSGIGMSSEQIGRLFTAFEQADNSTTRKFGGSGLGLAISRNLAQIMGGDISVSSALGVGSQFILSLPLPETTADIEPQIISQQDESRLQSLRVLAAEDVDLNRVVLEDILTHEGAHVIFAENGQQVLDRLEETGNSEFDVVLMDIQMPVMDGYQATRLILKNAPDLPVIGLTAHAMPEERQRCLDAGMRDRVTKPIDADDLVRAILQHISPKASADNIIDTNQEPILETESQAVSEVDTRPVLEVKSLIDWLAMLQRYNGRQAFIDKLINSALDGNHQENVHKLRDAAERQDYATIKFIAHSLKGVAGVFESQRLLDQAQQTEQAAKNHQENTTMLGIELADLLQCFLAELQYGEQAKHEE